MAACDEQSAHASVRSPATLTPRVRRHPRYELTRRPVLRSITRPTDSGARAGRQECQSARPGGAASLVAGLSVNPGCGTLVAGAGVMHGAGWRYDYNDVRPHNPREPNTGTSAPGVPARRKRHARLARGSGRVRISNRWTFVMIAGSAGGRSVCSFFVLAASRQHQHPNRRAQGAVGPFHSQRVGNRLRDRALWQKQL